MGLYITISDHTTGMENCDILSLKVFCGFPHPRPRIPSCLPRRLEIGSGRGRQGWRAMGRGSHRWAHRRTPSKDPGCPRSCPTLGAFIYAILLSGDRKPTVLGSAVRPSAPRHLPRGPPHSAGVTKVCQHIFRYRRHKDGEDRDGPCSHGGYVCWVPALTDTSFLIL